MPKSIVGYLALPSLFFAVPVHAQQATAGQDTGTESRLKLSGSIRARYEVLDGQFRPGFDDKDDLVSLRTTLLAEFDAAPLRFGAELYDSRAYDIDSGSILTTGEVNAFELVQAYVATDITEPLGKDTSLSVQAGRFTLNLGSRRLVAADDYRNTTNGYTGVRADLKLDKLTNATLFYTLPQQRQPSSFQDLRDNKVKVDREGFDLQLWGGLVSRKKLFGNTTGELGYVRLQEDDRAGRPTRNRNLHTFSVRLIRDPAPGHLDYEVEGMYQTGAIRSGLAVAAAALDVNAGFVHADLGYSFAKGWKPRVSIEFDYATGDKQGRTFSRFDTLFGMRRADLAPAGIYAALGRTNLATLGLRAEVTPSKRFDAFANARVLWAASASDSFSTTGVRDATGASGRFAGYQLESRLRYWIVPKTVRAEFNGAFLIKRGLLRTAPNATPWGNTRYGSFALTFSY